jgi:hypothetical protein
MKMLPCSSYMEDYTLGISWALSGRLDRVFESPHLPF